MWPVLLEVGSWVIETQLNVLVKAEERWSVTVGFPFAATFIKEEIKSVLTQLNFMTNSSFENRALCVFK